MAPEAHVIMARLRHLRPRDAVIEGYAEVEALLHQVATEHGISEPDSGLLIAYELRGRRLIPESGKKTVRILCQIRDVVAAGGPEPTMQQAEDYIETVGVAIRNLSKLLRSAAA